MKKRKLCIVSIAMFLLFSLSASTAVAREWKVNFWGFNLLFDIGSNEDLWPTPQDGVLVYLDNEEHTFLGSLPVEDVHYDYLDFYSEEFGNDVVQRLTKFTISGTSFRITISQFRWSDSGHANPQFWCSYVGDWEVAEWPYEQPEYEVPEGAVCEEVYPYDHPI